MSARSRLGWRGERRELKLIDCDVFYLGGWTSGEGSELVGGCRFLRKPDSITTAQAVVYNRSSFDRILADLPDDRAGMESWTRQWKAIDQYLNRASFIKVLAEPMIAVQSWVFGMPDPDRYFIR